MPYLIINNARDFVDFTRVVFGATEQLIVPTDDDKIMHGEIRIHEAVIMFGDAGDNWKVKTAAMYIYVSDVNSVYSKALKQHAASLQAPEQKDYGYTAAFGDPFGNQWFIVEAEK